MCTLSVLRDADKIQITFNRDERLSRKAEIAPHFWEDREILAPKDIKSGGTWIGVNPSSRSWACILNNYNCQQPDKQSDSLMSRGDIIPLVLSEEAPISPSEMELSRYRPFNLLIGKNDSVYEFCWDGSVFKEGLVSFSDDCIFRSSSSVKQNEVVSYRRKVFENWKAQGERSVVTKARVPLFHTSQQDNQKSYSILMSRSNPSRATTSICSIEIDSSSVNFHYFSSQSLESDTLRALDVEDINDKKLKTVSV